MATVVVSDTGGLDFTCVCSFSMMSLPIPGQVLNSQRSTGISSSTRGPS